MENGIGFAQSWPGIIAGRANALYVADTGMLLQKNIIMYKATMLKFHALAGELYGGHNGDIAGVLYSFIAIEDNTIW